MALVFGILGLVVFPLIGIAAWNLVVQARDELRTDPTQEGEGLATAGIVLGIIAVVMAVLLILFYIVVFLFVSTAA